MAGWSPRARRSIKLMMWDPRPVCGTGGHIVAAGPRCGIRVHCRGGFVHACGFCSAVLPDVSWTLETYGSHVGVSLQGYDKSRNVEGFAASWDRAAGKKVSATTTMETPTTIPTNRGL